MTVFYIFAMLPQSHMQNGKERIVSFTKAAHWWVYYYGVIQYLPSIIISIAFFL